MDLSRVQICDRFGLRAASFDAVSQFISCTPVPVRGVVVYPLTPKDEFILGCARVHGASFGGENNEIHTLPFHRFLCLRFLTSSVKETIIEIEQRNLATSRFSRVYLGHLASWFAKRLPAVLRPIVKKKRADTAEEEAMLRTLLKVLGIEWTYDNPQWIDDLFKPFPDHEARKIFELTLTTKGTREEKQAALEELLRFQWGAHPLDMYEGVFYDRGTMSDADWNYYISVLLPSDAKAYEAARVETTNAFIIREGMKPHFEEMRRYMAVELEKKIHGLFRINDSKAIGSHVAAYAKLASMEGGGGSTTEGYFSGIRIGTEHHPGGDETAGQEEKKAAGQ